MLRAVYVRTLKDGVTDDQYIDAWMPEGTAREDYPARVSVSRSTVDERQTVTVFEFDGDPDHVLDALAPLVRPDWRDRVAEVIEGTDVETIYVETVTYGSVGAPSASA
ncbi:hypothetical protein [Amnibacterium setariae]|uniref:REDY-like protein HapK n=1 Tax=Amnibacterium setariae TaxID=2306585 RepID=A0A3A1U315_9MICO|nr:hypothetical protein [Amnibacterium setariae]RIX30700.1 hypothetical protein D1781_04625 [Amnibacterium setariae]